MRLLEVSAGLAGQFARFDMLGLADSLKQARLLRICLAATLAIGTMSLATVGLAVHQVSKALELANASRHVTPVSATMPTVPSSTPMKGDFVSELPATPPTDLQIRFAAKLAHEQGVTIVQMQSEPLKSDASALGQSRITLQLRGDYRDIKTVWIAMLSKYPGLTLERLTIRHHADAVALPSPAVVTPLPASDHADDEASIEMIQYTRAPGTVR